MKAGAEEGKRCGRLNDDGFACDGTMGFREVEGCSCHISPPCGACVDNPLLCDVCDKGVDE